MLSVLRFTDSDYSIGILDLRILITSLWYLQTLLMAVTIYAFTACTTNVCVGGNLGVNYNYPMFFFMLSCI